MTQFFTAADGTRLAYRDEGAGLPLLCLPGLTRTMSDFDYLIPHLPPLRLIRMDYRGRGESQRSDPARYLVPQEAEDAVGLMDHLGLDRVAVIGASRGGFIALELAARARARLTGVMLIDMGPEIMESGLKRIFAYVGRQPAARTYEDMAALLDRHLPGFSGVPASRWMEEVRKHYREGPRGLEITYDPALRETFIASFGAKPVECWTEFDACQGMPLGLIRGAGSDLLSREVSERMRARRPDLIFAEVPGRGHMPFLDEPEALAAIRRFLEALG